MKYTITNKEFSSKKDIIEYCRELISRNKNKTLKGKDLKFMLEILKHHEDDRKLKDHTHIKVEIDKWERNYCLWVYKKRGDVELKDDISWTHCINQLPIETDTKVDYIFKFGKYKDESIYNIQDENYLKWLVNGDWLGRGDKILINQYLKYGYIPYNPVFWSKSKSKNGNK